MRRFTSLLAAALVLAGCRATPPQAPPVPPRATGIPQTTTAEVHPDPDRGVTRTEFPITVGTFADEEHGWMVADRTRLLATTDGGRQWSQVATLADDVRRLSFISESQGWAYTDRGVLSTVDGGHTWQPAAPERFPARSQFRDEQFGWDIEQKDGSSPSFLRLTRDGGQTWTRQPTPCKPGFQVSAASFINPQTGFLLCGFFQGSGGSSKWLYGTTDGGQRWELLTGTVYSQANPDFPPGVLVEPFKAPPEGALPTISGSGSLHFLDPHHGMISFSNFGPFVGSTYTTTDGGKTWTRLPVPKGLFTGDFRFFTPSFGRILVNNQRRWAWLETRDGGTTWEQRYPQPTPETNVLPEGGS